MTNFNPLVSILIPMFNGGSGIASTLGSILNQSYTNYEVIIVNDGSTDNGPDIARDVMPKARIISKENGGIANALNIGLLSCQGIFLARLDCFDQTLPGRLESQVAFLETHPQIGLVGGQVLLFDEAGDIGVSRYPTDSITIERQLLRGHSDIVHPACLIRMDLLKSIGAYDPFYEGVEDFELFTRMSLVTMMANVNEVVIRKQSIPGGLTYSGAHLSPLFELALYERDQRKVRGIMWKAEVLRAEYAERLEKLRKAYAESSRPFVLKSRFYAMRAGLMLRSGERKAALKDYLRSLRFQATRWRSIVGVVLTLLVPIFLYSWFLQIYKDWDYRRVQRLIKAIQVNAEG